MQDDLQIDFSGPHWYVASLVAALLKDPSQKNLDAVTDRAADLAQRPDLVELILRQGDALKVAKITLSGYLPLKDVFNLKKIKIAQEQVEKILNQRPPAELVVEFIRNGFPYKTDFVFVYESLSDSIKKNEAKNVPTREWEEIQKKDKALKERIQKFFSAHPAEFLKALFPNVPIDGALLERFSQNPAELLQDLITRTVAADQNLTLDALNKNLEEINQWTKMNGIFANLKVILNGGFMLFAGLQPFNPIKNALEKILDETKKPIYELEQWKITETEIENTKLAEQKALLDNANRHPHPPKPVQFSEAELVGTRRQGAEKTEDAHAHTPIDGFSELPQEEQERILKTTYAAEQARVAQFREAQNTGCTAVTTLAWTETHENKKVVKFVTANLADSSAYIFIRNKNTGVISKYQRLNKSLQNFADAAERQRVEAVGKTVTVSRSGTARVEGIAVARGFGDTNDDHNEFMGRVPDISFDEFTLEHDEELVFITGCDGLTEESSRVKFTNIDAVYLANKLHQYDATGAEDKRKLAEFLADEARKDSSTDDITVMTQVYDSNTQDGQAELFCIFDGHGGDFTSKQVGKNFIPTLKKTINPQSGLVQALKFIGAMILIPAVLIAAYFLAPVIIPLIGIKLAAAAAITALVLGVIGTIGLIRSMLSNPNKSKLPVQVVPEEDSELEEVVDETKRLTHSSVRSLRKVQALKGQPHAPVEMPDMAAPTGSLNADDFTKIKSQYVYEKVLDGNHSDLKQHYRQALQDCRLQSAEKKYICIALGSGNKAVIEIKNNLIILQGNENTASQDAVETHSIAQELGINFSLTNAKYFEQFQFSNKPRPK